MKIPTLDFEAAYKRLQGITLKTPLQFHHKFSEKYKAKIYLKREDLQIIRSYKIRGAFNLISQLTDSQKKQGVVCASAGNHAQGVAFSCAQLHIKGRIYMPFFTPKQKINQVKMFGNNWIENILIGDTFDECQVEALKDVKENNSIFVPPFDHPSIVEGQGTVAKEILEELPQVDYLILPIGGGGLCAGAASYVKAHAPSTKLIGVEPTGAPSMTEALKIGKPVTLEKIERFVDGASVKRVGDFNFAICQPLLEEMILVPEGKICTTILQLYNQDAIVAEPAGALAIAALDLVADKIKGKTVVCVVSGGNNDIERMQEIKERSLLYEGLKHYFIVRFAQRPGALKEFVNDILGPTDDIVRFEFIQKHNKENGPALIGIEVKQRKDHDSLMQRMKKSGINFTEVNQHENLFEYLV